MDVDPIAAFTQPAGAPIAQTEGPAADRVRTEVGAQRRIVYHEQAAADAAEVGAPDGEDHHADQRDADGRRLWEDVLDDAAEGASESETGKRVGHGKTPDQRQSKDPSRHSGNFLDATG